jgi:hypothetical protein
MWRSINEAVHGGFEDMERPNGDRVKIMMLYGPRHPKCWQTGITLAVGRLYLNVLTACINKGYRGIPGNPTPEMFRRKLTKWVCCIAAALAHRRTRSHAFCDACRAMSTFNSTEKKKPSAHGDAYRKQFEAAGEQAGMVCTCSECTHACRQRRQSAQHAPCRLAHLPPLRAHPPQRSRRGTQTCTTWAPWAPQRSRRSSSTSRPACAARAAARAAAAAAAVPAALPTPLPPQPLLLLAQAVLLWLQTAWLRCAGVQWGDCMHAAAASKLPCMLCARHCAHLLLSCAGRQR